MAWRYSRIAAVALAVLAAAAGVARPAGRGPDADATRYFYRGLAYGSDATFHPVSELVNGSFGILQISSNWRPLDDIDFAHGLDMTWRSISHPLRVIDAYGREAFVRNELLPIEFGWRGLQWVPNYSLHLIGGGARHRAFMEWYRAHGFAMPTLWAWATTTVHAFGVEMVEASNNSYPTADPVADMLVFDPLGALLFSSDHVAAFFAHTLHMSIWSGQPMYNPVANTFENAGQNYALHYFLGERFGLFSYWGMSHLFGVTVRGGRFDWSAGLGGAVDELREDDQGHARRLYARIKLDAGFFIHRDGSLLASIHVSQAWTQHFRLNVYPSWIRTGGMATSVFTGVRGDDVIVGVSLQPLPVGVALSR